MDAEPDHVIDKILNLTLETVYLLTGEKYMVVKMVSVEGLLQGMYPPMCGEWSRTQSTTMEPPPSSLTPEINNGKKVLEVTQKIIGLLTGETPLEEFCSFWKKATMKNQQTLTSPDLCVGETETSSMLKEELYTSREQNLLEGRAHVRVDCTAVTVKEDLLDEDGCTPRAPPSAKIVENSPRNADVSDIERWPPVAHVKEEINETDSKSFIIEKLFSGDKDSLEQSAQMSLTFSPVEDGTMPSGNSSMFRDGNGITDQSSIAPPSQSAAVMIYSCDGCKKIFSCSDFLLHKSTCQSPPLACAECGKCFGRRQQLVRHRRIHTRPKLYTCPECEKSFGMKSQLVVHQRVHTGEKPFSCADCGRGFARQQLLDSHKVIHSGERPFACSECQMTFSRTSPLIIHRRIHSGEKPYSCSECNRSFRTRSVLIGHQRTHTGERPYHCSVCGKCYAHRSHLVVHQRSHSGEKPYACLECGKSFTHKSGLVRHQRIHKRQPP